MAARRPRFLSTALLLICTSGAGCKAHRNPDMTRTGQPKTVRLDGTYGVRQGKELVPVLQVAGTKTGYSFTERVTDEWKPDPQAPHVVSEAEVERALHLPSVTGFYVFGLGTDSVLLLKVPAGWTGGQPSFTTKTGYVLVSNAVAQPAEKVELGSR